MRQELCFYPNGVGKNFHHQKFQELKRLFLCSLLLILNIISARAAPLPFSLDYAPSGTWEMGMEQLAGWPKEPVDSGNFALQSRAHLAYYSRDIAKFSAELPLHGESQGIRQGWSVLSVGDPRVSLGLIYPSIKQASLWRAQVLAGLTFTPAFYDSTTLALPVTVGPDGAYKQGVRMDGVASMAIDGRSISKVPLALILQTRAGAGPKSTRDWAIPGAFLVMEPIPAVAWNAGAKALRFLDGGKGEGRFFVFIQGGFVWQARRNLIVEGSWMRNIGSAWTDNFPLRNQANLSLRWQVFPSPKNIEVKNPYSQCPQQEGCPQADTDGDKVCDSWIALNGLALRYANTCLGSDICPEVAGVGTDDGCPQPDGDVDSVCEEWVAKFGHQELFAEKCKGSDRCPMVAGPNMPDGCPQPDQDHDGVCDAWVSQNQYFARYGHICKGLDGCPQLAGPGIVDGCPIFDSDRDGICDHWVADEGHAEKYEKECKGRDQCPNHPENFNNFKDEDGCPDRSPLEERWDALEPLARRPQSGVLEEVRFHVNSLHMRPEAAGGILQLARQMKAFPRLLVEIRGYTDDRLTMAENLVQSQQQAELVMRELLLLGVPPNRLRAVGAGSERPMQSNTRVAGRFQNRRIEIVVFEGN